MNPQISFSAVLFDMDGVLITSEHIWAQCEIDFFKSLVGNKLEGHDEQTFLGKSPLGIFKTLQKNFELPLPQQEFLERYLLFGLTHVYSKIELSPNVLTLLQDLSQKNIPCALVSSSPYVWIYKALEKTGIAPYFKIIVSADDVEGKGKPEPDIYLLASKRIGIPPFQCLVIEDSDNGLLAGKRAGMQTIGVRNGVNENQKLINADRIWTGILPKI